MKPASSWTLEIQYGLQDGGSKFTIRDLFEQDFTSVRILPLPHRHWLFGEKIFDEPEEPRKGTKKDKKKKQQQQQQQSEPLPEAHKPPRIRGWFPRQCAVELVEDEDEAEQQQHFNEKKKNK